MKKINENKLAKEVAAGEAGLQELNIAQIKETIKVTLEVLANHYEMSQNVELLERHYR